MMTEDLRARLAEQAERHRLERAQSILDGGATLERLLDGGSIHDAQQALDDAEALVLRRERDAAATAHAEHLAKLRRDIGEADERRLAAIDRAGAACKAMVAALAEAQAEVAAILAHGRQLGHRPPLPLSGDDPELRASQRIADALATIAIAPKARFGRLKWHAADPRNVTPWRDAETRTTAGHVAALMKDRDHG